MKPESIGSFSYLIGELKLVEGFPVTAGVDSLPGIPRRSLLVCLVTGQAEATRLWLEKRCRVLHPDGIAVEGEIGRLEVRAGEIALHDCSRRQEVRKYAEAAADGRRLKTVEGFFQNLGNGKTTESRADGGQGRREQLLQSRGHQRLVESERVFENLNADFIGGKRSQLELEKAQDIVETNLDSSTKIDHDIKNRNVHPSVFDEESEL